MPPSSTSAITPASHASVLALLVLLVALAYGNSLQNGFTFDDESLIAQNPLIKKVHHLPKLFTKDYWAGSRDPDVPASGKRLYRPLVLLSYAANYAAGGLNPFGFHLVNVLLHLTVTWLLYLVGLQVGLSYRAAAIAAVLFATHPIHTEAVSGVVGRSELMMAIGVLAGLWWFIHGRPGPSLIAFGFGLLSKEQAATLPALLLLYDLAVPRHFAGSRGGWELLRRAVRRYAPYILVMVGYGFLRWWVLGGALNVPTASYLDNPLAHLESPLHLVNALRVAGLYLWLCVWPASLSADYSYNAIPLAASVLDTEVLLALLAWLSLLGIAVWSFRRDRRASFCIGLLMVTFLPTSNLAIPIGTIMGERLFYLPSAGLCLLLAVGYERVTEENRTWSLAGLVLLSVICLAFLVRTVVRNGDWVDTEQMARSAVGVVPNDAKVHSILGRLAKDRGKWDEAITHFQTALSIYPEYSHIDVTLNSNLGISLIEKGLMAEGIEALERAVNIDPRWSLLRYNLGFAYAKQGRDREAEAAYRQALSLNDEDPRAYTGLGFLFLKQERYAEALASAETGLERDPQYREALFVRARALQALGQTEKTCLPGFPKC